MRPTLPVLLAALTATLLPQTAGANSMVLQFTAHVNTFCRINTASDLPIAVVNGAAEIGPVQEICNTPNGYEVLARFSNLSGGKLNVAGQDYTIDDTGGSLRHIDGPRSQTLNWQLGGAQIVQPLSPVLMQVTITPL